MAENVEIYLKAENEASSEVEQVTLDAEKLTQELRDAAKAAGEYAPQLGKVADELDSLTRQQRVVQEIKQLKTELLGSSRALIEAKDKTRQLAFEVKNSTGSNRELNQELSKSRARLKQLAGVQKEQISNYRRLKSEAESYGINTRNLNTAQRSLSSSIDATTKRARDLQSQLGQTSRSARSAGDAVSDAGKEARGFSDSIRGATARVVGFVGALLTVQKGKQFLTSVLNTGGQFETFQTQLEGVFDSISEAEGAFDWIESFTETVPLQLDQTLEAFIKLKNFGLDPMDGTLQALVDKNSELGGSQERLNGIILAVGQAWAKQKLQAEETLQLVERGVPVYELLQRTTGKTAGELEELSRNGELGRDAIKALIEEMGKDSVGQAAKEMANYRGIVSNLKDDFVQFLNEIADKGVLDYFKGQLKDLRATIQQMADDGRLEQLAKRISDFMITGAEATKNFLGIVVSLSRELKILASAFLALKFGKMLQGLWGMAAGGAAAATSIKALTLALIRTGWGAIAVGIGWVVGKIWELNEASAEAQRQQQELAEKQREVDQVYAELSDRLGIQIRNSRELIEAEREGLIVFDEKARRYELVKQKTEEATEAQSQYEIEINSTTDALTQHASAIVQASQRGQEFVSTLNEMKSSEDGLEESLRKLNDGQFASFIAKLEDATKSDYLTGLEAVETQSLLSSEALTRLGVDAEKLSTGLSTAGKNAIQYFDFISASAQSTSATIKAAFDGALNNVQTRQGLDALKRRVEELGQSGRLTGDQVKQALEQITDAAERVDEKLVKARETLQELGQGINSADTVSGLDDIGIAAAQAWQDGKISAEEYLEVMAQVDAQKEKLIETTQRLAEAEKESADAAKDKANAEEDSGKQIIVARQAATEASKQEAEALAKAREEINKTALAHGYGIEGLKRYWDAVEELRDRYVEANKGAQEMAASVAMLDANTSVSVDTLEQYAEGLESAIRNGDELNSQSLSALQSALSSVRSKIQAITSETQSAKNELSGLQSELAGLEGDQQRVQEIQFLQRRADLMSKIKEAEAEGNTEAVKSYEASLAILTKINQIKQRNIQQSEREVQLQNQTQQPATGQQPNGLSTPARTVRMVFEAADGKQASVYADEADADNVVDIMTNAKGVSAK